MTRDVDLDVSPQRSRDATKQRKALRGIDFFLTQNTSCLGLTFSTLLVQSFLVANNTTKTTEDDVVEAVIIINLIA